MSQLLRCQPSEASELQLVRKALLAQAMLVLPAGQAPGCERM